ncbi:hypothetical protein B0H14DRAFT_2559265 [Mycena olivaceomarginata]|nr:hypothetical protein B0H14DRAFT_2559265 [Mycena olivaceomarginata]
MKGNSSETLRQERESSSVWRQGLHKGGREKRRQDAGTGGQTVERATRGLEWNWESRSRDIARWAFRQGRASRIKKLMLSMGLDMPKSSPTEPARQCLDSLADLAGSVGLDFGMSPAECSASRLPHSHHQPAASYLTIHQGPTSHPSTGPLVIVPTLTIAKAGVTGIGIPGVEPAFNGVLELAEMLSVRFHTVLALSHATKLRAQTMEANKEDLLDLKKNLGSLTTTIDNLDAGDSSFRELKGMVPECTTLAEKHSLQRFFKSKNYKQRIQDMKSTMESHLYKFTLLGLIC